MNTNAIESILNLASEYPQCFFPNLSNNAADQLGIDLDNISLVEKMTLSQFSLLCSPQQLSILSRLCETVFSFYNENGIFNNAQMTFLNQRGFKKSAYILRYRTKTYFNLILAVGIRNDNGENIDFLTIKIDMLKKLKQNSSDYEKNIICFFNKHFVEMVSKEAIDNRLSKIQIKDYHHSENIIKTPYSYDGLFLDTMPQNLFSKNYINSSSLPNSELSNNRLSSVVNYFEEVVKTYSHNNELSLLACALAYWDKNQFNALPSSFINLHFCNVFFKELESNVFNISHVVLDRIRSNSKHVVFELYLGITPKNVLQKWLSDCFFVNNSVFKEFEHWFNLPANMSVSYEIEFVENNDVLNFTIKANDLLSSQFINGINTNRSVAKMLLPHTKFGQLSVFFSDCVSHRIGDDWENFKKLQTAYYEHMMYNGIDLNADDYENYAYFDESILSVTNKLSNCQSICGEVYPLVLCIDGFYVPYKMASGMLLHSPKNYDLSCFDKSSWVEMDCSLSFVDLSEFIESNELGIVIEINNPSGDILAYADMLKAVW